MFNLADICPIDSNLSGESMLARFPYFLAGNAAACASRLL